MRRASLHILIAMLFLLQSCIKDRDKDIICEGELLLRYRYTLNDQYSNLFGSEVKSVTIYIFDDKGKYVKSFSEHGDQLTNDYVMRVSLPYGKYSVIAYGGYLDTYSTGEINSQNMLDKTLRKGVTDINNFRLELNNIIGEGDYLYPADIPNDLYAGLATNVISDPINKNTIDVELIKDTKKIKVKIYGIDALNSTVVPPLDIYITAINGRYKFENSIDVNHPTFKYTPINSLLQPNYMEVDLKIMRLALGQSPMLVIKNSLTSEIIYNENIIDQILSTQKYISQEDFDREDEFVFEITIHSNGDDVDVSASINGWEINNITPGI